MKRWFENFTYKLNRWMYGRYGNDELNTFMSITSLILIVVTCIFRVGILTFIALAMIIWMNIRCFSKNHPARKRELEGYLRIKNKLTKKTSLYKEMWKNRKSYRYFKCKNCKAILRVPKGRGNIEITCRKCQYKMRKRS